MEQLLEKLLTAARQEESLRQALLDSRTSTEPVVTFCETATRAGFAMTAGELLASGETYADNLLKSCNGGAEYPIEGWEDAYEMFLAALL